jgi:NAD(P)-dependent dehydrogenase (short-subunit alcohol dehydrogenase family)
MKENIVSQVPMHRLGQSIEIASTVAWLLSDNSNFLTGTVIPIDGGRLSGTP